MTLRQFTAFDVVAKYLNVTRAARALGTSQPSLSRHIKALEETYKIKLFKKTRDGIALTEEGVDFLNRVRRILMQIEQLKERFCNGPSDKRPQRLLLAGTYALATGIVPSLLSVFKKRYPEIAVEVMVDHRSGIEQMLLKGTVELGICSRPPSSSRLASESFVPLRLVAFAAKTYPIARKSTLTLAELEKIPLVILSRRTRTRTDRMLAEYKKRGYKPNIAIRCESPEIIKAAVRNRMGVGFLFDDSIRDEVHRGIFKIFRIPELPCLHQSHIIFHKTKPLSPTAEEFLQLLRGNRDKSREA
jgi:DNA-binding transcriptional LysR family regulator